MIAGRYKIAHALESTIYERLFIYQAGWPGNARTGCPEAGKGRIRLLTCSRIAARTLSGQPPGNELKVLGNGQKVLIGLSTQFAPAGKIKYNQAKEARWKPRK